MDLCPSSFSNMDNSHFDIHDYTFSDLKVDYTQKSAQIEIVPPCPNAPKKKIKFSNLIGLELVTCDFWGSSPHILALEILPLDRQNLIRALLKEKAENCYKFSRLPDDPKFIEVVITFTSGDRLTIACEHISSTGDGFARGQRDGSVVPSGTDE